MRILYLYNLFHVFFNGPDVNVQNSRLQNICSDRFILTALLLPSPATSVGMRLCVDARRCA